MSGYELGGDGVQVRCIPIAEWRFIQQWIEAARSALELAYAELVSDDYDMPHRITETLDAIHAVLLTSCLPPPERK